MDFADVENYYITHGVGGDIYTLDKNVGDIVLADDAGYVYYAPGRGTLLGYRSSSNDKLIS